MNKPAPRIVRMITYPGITGPTLQAALLHHRFGQIGYDTWMITGGDESTSTFMLNRFVEPDRLITLDSMSRSTSPFKILRAIGDVYQILQRLQPDIVHTHTTTAGFIGRIAAKMAGVPAIVHTLHYHPFKGHYNQRDTWAFITVERIGALLSHSIITLSSNLREELATKYNITSKNRLSIMPLGFDLNRFADTPRHMGVFRERFSIPSDVPLVGIVGRLMPVKNYPLFIKAAAQLRKSYPDAWFAVIGDGGLRAELEQLADAQGVSDRVIFTGWQDEMPPVYSDLDVLVNCSLNEGTPIPIIEALAAMCPVVAADVGGIPDLLEGGRLGRLIPSDDLSALVTAIDETLQNPPNTTQMDAAQNSMLRRYGLESLVQDMDSLYRGLLARNRY